MAAIDDLQSLYGTLTGRANVLDPSLSSLQGLSGQAAGVYGNAFANQNTATGLSPEALSALRTQATSGINDQYQSAAQAMNSQLLRRGAVGSAQLPGSGGDISRAYQPLYTAMEAQRSTANQNTILADEAAKRQSLYQNQQLAQNAANSLFGNTASIFNSSNAPLNSAASVANSIADLEPGSWQKILMSSLLSGAASGKGLVGGLVSGGGTNGTGNFGVIGDALGKIFNPDQSSAPSSGPLQGPIDPSTGTRGGVIGVPDALQGTLAGTSMGIPGLDGGTPPFAAPPPNATSATGDVVKAGSGAVGALETAAQVTGKSLASVASSVGHVAVALAENPITWAVGAALIAGIAWVKSQAHWEANTWTQGFQKPFDDKMEQVHTQVNALKASGQYTPDVAAQVQSSAKDALDAYRRQLDTFYREKGTDSDQGKVAAQAYQTFLKYYGQDGQGYLNQLAA